MDATMPLPSARRARPLRRSLIGAIAVSALAAMLVGSTGPSAAATPAAAPTGAAVTGLRDLLPNGALGSYGEYTPITPARLMDTRQDINGLTFPLVGGVDREISVVGRHGVPEFGYVEAVVLNVTAVTPTDAGFLTVFPTGQLRPDVSNLNFTPGQTVANQVTVKAGRDGRVSLYNLAGWTHAVVDIVGYYSSAVGPAGSRFTASHPVRMYDTRKYPLIPYGTMHTVNVGGYNGAPSNARAVVLNVTVDGATHPGFLSVNGGNAVSNLNYEVGRPRANLVTAQVSYAGLQDGHVTIYHNTPAHVIVDIMGWYTNDRVGDRGRFVPFAKPERRFDSRSGNPLPPSCCAAPVTDPDAGALSLNVTAVNPTGGGWLMAIPADREPVGTSNLNYVAGEIVPNAVIVGGSKVSSVHDGVTRPAGSAIVRVGVNPTHVLIDLFGGFLRE